MLALALAFNLFVFLLACVGMMVVFMGGGGYLSVLVVLLSLSLPVSLLMSMGGCAWFIGRLGVRQGLQELWQNVPPWLTVAVWLGVALIFCGELALLITLRLHEKAPGLWQHLPLLAGLSAAIAFWVIEAVRVERGRLA